MDAIMNVMNGISSEVWIGIGAGVGSFIGCVITFWVAEGVGFREGTRHMQKHYEEMASRKRQPEITEMPAPTEEVEAETEPEKKTEPVLASA